jgi:hypothetical protein
MSYDLSILKRDNNKLKSLFRVKQKVVEEYNILHNLWRDILKIPQNKENELINSSYDEFKIRYEMVITDFRQICTEFNISMNNIQEVLKKNKEEKDDVSI